MSKSPMPSIVVTSAPSHWTASTVQLLTASPSTWQVHAPQFGGVAADVRAGQAELFAQVVHEQQSRLDLRRMSLSVDGHLQGDGAVHELSSHRAAGEDRLSTPDLTPFVAKASGAPVIV
jgi:hypothetical protein